MKNLIAVFKNKLLLLMMVFTLSASVDVVYAQSYALKISSISQIESTAKEGSDAVKSIALYVVGAVLAIGLIFVIYALATSNPKAKEYLIGWIIAVIVILIAGMIIK